MAKLGDSEKRTICIAKGRDDYVVATVRKGPVKFTGRSKSSCCKAVGKLFLAHGDKFGLLIDVVELAGCSTARVRWKNISGQGNSREEAVGRMIKEHAAELGFKVEYDNGSFEKKECN